MNNNKAYNKSKSLSLKSRFNEKKGATYNPSVFYQLQKNIFSLNNFQKFITKRFVVLAFNPFISLERERES